MREVLPGAEAGAGKELQGRGLKLLYAVAWPGQGLYTRDPLKSAAT
jgi:hypothetical protein